MKGSKKYNKQQTLNDAFEIEKEGQKFNANRESSTRAVSKVNSQVEDEEDLSKNKI